MQSVVSHKEPPTRGDGNDGDDGDDDATSQQGRVE